VHSFPQNHAPQRNAYADSKNEIKINGNASGKRRKTIYLFVFLENCGTLLYVLSLGK